MTRWYARGIAQIGDRMIPVVTDLAETSLSPTLFFSYFDKLPTHTIYSELPELPLLVEDVLVEIFGWSVIENAKKRQEEIEEFGEHITCA